MKVIAEIHLHSIFKNYTYCLMGAFTFSFLMFFSAVCFAITPFNAQFEQLAAETQKTKPLLEKAKIELAAIPLIEEGKGKTYSNEKDRNKALGQLHSYPLSTTAQQKACDFLAEGIPDMPDRISKLQFLKTRSKLVLSDAAPFFSHMQAQIRALDKFGPAKIAKKELRHLLLEMSRHEFSRGNTLICILITTSLLKMAQEYNVISFTPEQSENLTKLSLNLRDISQKANKLIPKKLVPMFEKNYEKKLSLLSDAELDQALMAVRVEFVEGNMVRLGLLELIPQ